MSLVGLFYLNSPFWSLTCDLENSEFDTTVNEETLESLPLPRRYAASKILANQAGLDFKKTKRPQFELVTLYPAYVYGPSLLQKTAGELSGTNALLYYTLKSQVPNMPMFPAVHVIDVAEAHVKALDPSVPDMSRFILSTQPQLSTSEIIAFLNKEYPSLAQEWSLEPENQPPWTVDSSRAEEVLKIKWRPVEAQFKEVIDQQLSFATGAEIQAKDKEVLDSLK